MKQDFMSFSKQLEKIRVIDYIPFKKLYNKKLNLFLLTGSEELQKELYQLQKSFNKFYKKV